MTFDDGPSATLTPKLLDLLAAHHIKATFFVIGENVRNIPRSSREPHAKDTKSRATVGRTPISPRCRRKVFAASYSGPTMKLKSATGNVPLYFGRRMDRLPNAKNDGSTTNSDMTSFFGTLIRSTGNDPARR
jgi:Predicted xylanase/chitin deacetylase